MRILISDIKELLQVEYEARNMIAGKSMAELKSVPDAYLLIEGKEIAGFGPMSELKNSGLRLNAYKQIDANGCFVAPAFCDSHTHLVYPASREIEYIDKIKGLSYEEIAKRGGGILNSARLLQQTSEEELYESAWKRLEQIISMGTGAVEIKSGYGLSPESEIKMLRVIRRLRSHSPLSIRSTFLGAHAIPSDYKKDPDAYVDLVVEKMLPQVADEGLADYVDVFCDRGFFTVPQTDRILEKAVKLGMIPKIHANELDFSGGIQVGVKHGALSVDHLEFTGSEEIESLRNSGTMPTLLPSAAFFLGMEYPPARKMIDAGLPVALASDFNPGSSPSGNMQFVLSLASIQMKMTPEEAINAATLNGAYAMGLEKRLGSIAVGKRANVMITHPIPSYAYIPYSFGDNKISTVILNGVVQ